MVGAESGVRLGAGILFPAPPSDVAPPGDTLGVVGASTVRSGAGDKSIGKFAGGVLGAGVDSELGGLVAPHRPRARNAGVQGGGIFCPVVGGLIGAANKGAALNGVAEVRAVSAPCAKGTKQATSASVAAMRFMIQVGVR